MEIRTMFGKVLYESEDENLRAAVIKAVKKGIDLRGIDLQGANLRGADLQGAHLRCAHLRCAGLLGADFQNADLRDAVLEGANFQSADLRGADLRGANLWDTNLRGANLHSADFRGAYFRGANGKKIRIEKTPIQIITDFYDVTIFDNHIKIGCKFHSIKSWNKFDQDHIKRFGKQALEFWKTWKESILSICKDNDRE